MNVQFKKTKRKPSWRFEVSPEGSQGVVIDTSPTEAPFNDAPAGELLDDSGSPSALLHDVFHRGVASVALFTLLPLLLLLMALIRLTSRGPAIYAQDRVGRHGRVFRMYKLRSMPHEIERETGAVWAGVRDNRATLLGRYLRALHLDELPQLLNVIRGEMSLVGPRPERPEFTHRLAREISGYLRRLDVRPGITGLAQINLPPDSNIDSVRRKTALDTHYVNRRSAWLDVRIMAATAFCPVVALSKAARRCLRVYHDEPLACVAPPLEEPENDLPSRQFSGTVV